MVIGELFDSYWKFGFGVFDEMIFIKYYIVLVVFFNDFNIIVVNIVWGDDNVCFV